MISTELISSAEAARRLGVNRSTLTRWVAAGRIEPAVTVPGYRGDFLFAAEDVSALVAERKAS